MSTSELVASTIGFEVSVVSASYTACLDPRPLPHLPLLHHDPLVLLLEFGVLMVGWVYLDIQLKTIEAFLYYSWTLVLGVALQDHPLL